MKFSRTGVKGQWLVRKLFPWSGCEVTGPWTSMKIVHSLFVFGCTNGVLDSWSGLQPISPALETWSLNHWTAREDPIVHSFLLPSNNPSYGCNTICLSIYQVIDIWVFSNFGVYEYPYKHDNFKKKYNRFTIHIQVFD